MAKAGKIRGEPAKTKAAPAVRALGLGAKRGRLKIGHQSIPCGLGRSGRRVLKREGDGATPLGRWILRQVFYRSDRVLRPRTGLPVRPLRPTDGWCDAPGDRNYNRYVTHPYPMSAEHLWRQDHLYDIVVVLAYNERPRVRGRGSAIFMHLARPGYLPTEGCISLSARDMRLFLSGMSRGAAVVVSA